MSALDQGPAGARVDDVTMKDITIDALDDSETAGASVFGFEIRPTV